MSEELSERAAQSAMNEMLVEQLNERVMHLESVLKEIYAYRGEDQLIQLAMVEAGLNEPERVNEPSNG